MKPIVLSLMLFFMVTAAQAQESGAPPQSGGQEPEMPGNETTITPSKRVLPEAAPEQKQLRQQKHEREKRIENVLQVRMPRPVGSRVLRTNSREIIGLQ